VAPKSSPVATPGSDWTERRGSSTSTLAQVLEIRSAELTRGGRRRIGGIEDGGRDRDLVRSPQGLLVEADLDLVPSGRGHHGLPRATIADDGHVDLRLARRNPGQGETADRIGHGCAVAADGDERIGDGLAGPCVEDPAGEGDGLLRREDRTKERRERQDDEGPATPRHVGR
jgi:hypothetical protein